MTFGDGPWKEGRIGASTLCYLNPRADQLRYLISNHRAVGIRATIAFGGPTLPDTVADLRSWNWDLAVLDSQDASATLAALQATSARLPGVFVERTSSLPDAGYIVTRNSGTIARAPVAGVLSSMPAHSDLGTMTQAIWEIATRNEWAIWRFDEATLHAFGESSHAELLRWLGERHDRVYCAPVWDVRSWQLANP